MPTTRLMRDYSRELCFTVASDQLRWPRAGMLFARTLKLAYQGMHALVYRAFVHCMHLHAVIYCLHVYERHRSPLRSGFEDTLRNTCVASERLSFVRGCLRYVYRLACVTAGLSHARELRDGA